MNTKISILTAFILFCICMSGCTSGDSDDSSDNGTVAKATVIEGADGLNSVEEFSGELDFEYVYETDCQSDLGEYSSTVYTSDGYYIIDHEYDSTEDKKYLKFYDYAAEQLVYVCSKSNCSHNGSGCDAYFDTGTFPMDGLWYYDGNLYVPMLDEDYICICKISLDGTTRENVCTIQRLNIEETEEEDGSVSTTTYYPILQLHRGYVYYSTAINNASGELARVKLSGDADAETICALETDENDMYEIYRIKPYGKYVFFQISHYSGDEYTGAIYAFDTESADGIMKVCDDCIRDYTVFDNKIAYFDLNDDIYIKDPESGSNELFYDLDTENMFTFDFDSDIFSYDDYLVYKITDSDVEYDEDTDTYIVNEYQLLIDRDGAVQKILEPEDEKLYPYEW